MTTRAITEVRRRWGAGEWRTLAVIYTHCDGYPGNGLGRWLFTFLDGLVVLNGVGASPPPRYTTGPGNLAAELVQALCGDDWRPGLIGSVLPVGQEWHYRIDVQYGKDGGAVAVVVFKGPGTMFGDGGERCTEQVFCGSVAEFGEFVTDQAA